MATQWESSLDGRALHLLDVENLAGLPPDEATSECYGAALADYFTAVRPSPDDYFIVGAHPSNILKALEVFRHFKVLPQRGKDGGDLALIDYALNELKVDWILERYSTVWVGSGDGIFTKLIVELKPKSVRTRVAGRARHVSMSLVEAVGIPNVTWLPEHFCRDHALRALLDIGVIDTYLRSRAALD